MAIKFQSAFFILQWIQEWECYIQANCRAYTGTFIEQAAIAPAHFPMFAYLLIFFLTFYDRSVFHVVLSIGLTINGIIISLLSIGLQAGRIIDTGCRLTVAATPSDDVSVLWFIFLYCLAYDLRLDGWRIYRCFSTWITFVAAGLTVAAQLILSLYDVTEIIAGLMLGLLNATWLSFVLHRLILPRFNTWYVQRICGWLTISRKHIRYDSKADREFFRCSAYFNADIEMVKQPQADVVTRYTAIQQQATVQQPQQEIGWHW